MIGVRIIQQAQNYPVNQLQDRHIAGRNERSEQHSMIQHSK